MPKSAPTLDTPYRRGEKVLTTRALDGRPQGSVGKVKLANGLSTWRRYWVRFGDGEIVGQVDHRDLVRPSQVDQWHARVEAEAAAAQAPASDDAPDAVAATSDGGVASQIPATILERSKAAKARLLGGG